MAERLLRLVGVVFALMPVSASAAVILQVAGNTPPVCFGDSPACDRSVSIPLGRGAIAGGLPEVVY